MESSDFFFISQQHPSFWPGFRHQDGSFGFNFSRDESEFVPWETTPLNLTKNVTEHLIFDYSLIHTDHPPRFVPYAFEIFDWRGWATYATINWHLPFVVGFVYLTLCFGLEKWMRNRQPFNLKWPLFVWNFAFGVFSIVGLIRTWPEFYSILMGNNGFYKAICYRDGGNYPSGFWSLLFVLSKYLELGDTVFIILRKKPLVFIQWYHHFVSVLIAWLNAPYIEPISRWYVVMNFGVHSMMYPYFAFRVLGLKIPRKIAIFITTCQLSQMLVGLFINLCSALLIRIGVPCYRHPFSIKLSLIVYGSFTLLFGKLLSDVLNSKKDKLGKPKLD